MKCNYNPETQSLTTEVFLASSQYKALQTLFNGNFDQIFLDFELEKSRGASPSFVVNEEGLVKKLVYKPFLPYKRNFRTKAHPLMKGVEKLIALEELGLSEAGINEVPENIQELHNLTKLDLSINNIAHIPANSINNLPNLTELYLNKNNLEEVPILHSLYNLLELSLKDNKIRELPEMFKTPNLGSMRYFNISDNKISALNDSCFQFLHELETLSFGRNPLDFLPKSLIKLRKLKYLEVRDIKFGFRTRNILRTLKLKGVCVSYDYQLWF